MAITQPAASTNDVVPDGTWQVNPESSELGFTARGVFGLVPVHGIFGSYEGELEVEGRDLRGELRIDAATLDTKNQKRDAHLRSADFFHVTEYPIVTFSLTELTSAPDGALELGGTLQIRDNKLALRAPVQVSRLDNDRFRLDTDVSVDRAAAGVGWSKMGAIKGRARLGASILLVRV
jgi:polyisoprenoid-binding protein YceI